MQAELAKHDDKPMATGENLFSMQDVRNLIRYGGMRPPDVPGHRRRPGPGRHESYPDLFQPCGGFSDGVKVVDSYVTLPELPGIGFEGKSGLYAEMKALAS